MFATLILNGAPLLCPPGGEAADLSIVVPFTQKHLAAPGYLVFSLVCS